MNITRRQFGRGVLVGLIAMLFGKIFGGCKAYEEPSVDKGVEARHWTQADHLAG